MIFTVKSRCQTVCERVCQFKEIFGEQYTEAYYYYYHIMSLFLSMRIVLTTLGKMKNSSLLSLTHKNFMTTSKRYEERPWALFLSYSLPYLSWILQPVFSDSFSKHSVGIWTHRGLESPIWSNLIETRSLVQLVLSLRHLAFSKSAAIDNWGWIQANLRANPRRLTKENKCNQRKPGDVSHINEHEYGKIFFFKCQKPILNEC